MRTNNGISYQHKLNQLLNSSYVDERELGELHAVCEKYDLILKLLENGCACIYDIDGHTLLNCLEICSDDYEWMS